jgi:hypothetical protein
MGRLKGASMIEAIVASLIFLLAFAISLSTLTGLTLREDEGYVLLEVERAISDRFTLYGDGIRAQGTYTDTYEWGKITTSITRYGDYENIQQVAMRATITGSRKTIEYRRLVTTTP